MARRLPTKSYPPDSPFNPVNYIYSSTGEARVQRAKTAPPASPLEASDAATLPLAQSINPSP